MQCKGPLSEPQIIKLAAGGVPEARVIQFVNTCGVGFQLTQDSEERLKAAGATPAVLDAIREKFAKPPAPKIQPPTPPPPAPPPNDAASIAPPDLPRSHYERGQAYEEGRGVSQDYAEAAKWYRRAADEGNADAENSLGWLYRSGRGVP